jgi:alanyl-tRNA synthetase
MIKIKANELRKKYLEFFKEKGHTIISGASLIPENDPTVLFTTAGMHPLVPYLMGEKHPAGQRLANFQKCLRTTDIDEIGDDWHLTFFEMLGNWSLGDYFKKEAIEWSWEFLTSEKWLNIPPMRLYVTVFEGDEDAPRDEEAIHLWQNQFEKAGIEPTVWDKNKPEMEARIYPFPKSENWWGPAGETGPCGPCTEIFYDTGREKCSVLCNPSCKCGKYPEIWNNVFMEYSKTKDGHYELLKQKNIDTGMGLERTVAVLNHFESVYEIELFTPIINKIIELIAQKGVSREEILISYKKAIRIIADHLKAATFILGDPVGVAPSNLKQGYILRRLIRRALRYGRLIGIEAEKKMTIEIAKVVIEIYKELYPELLENQERILSELSREEERFDKTLALGLKEFNKMVKNKQISGYNAFILFSTYGFPLEMTKELAQEKGIVVDEKGFYEEFKKHQELSRTAAAGIFKGGLADASEETKKLHTATHLLQAALRSILGEHVTQKGSNITPERLRFDFSHSKKLTEEEIQKINDFVNEKINLALPVHFEEMTVEEAKEKGAIGLFTHKYGEKVKVYFIGKPGNYVSIEICGGPHVENTKELGHFKIIKEEAVSAGVRRIKAILE